MARIASDELVEMARKAPRDASASAVLALVARIDALRERIAELERRKPAESPWPTASGFPDP